VAERSVDVVVRAEILADGLHFGRRLDDDDFHPQQPSLDAAPCGRAPENLEALGGKRAENGGGRAKCQMTAIASGQTRSLDHGSNRA